MNMNCRKKLVGPLYFGVYFSASLLFLTSTFARIFKYWNTPLAASAFSAARTVLLLVLLGTFLALCGIDRRYITWKKLDQTQWNSLPAYAKASRTIFAIAFFASIILRLLIVPI